ncbi:hypothetical protein ACW66K_00725 [Aerococcus urinaeequi]
MTPDDEQQLTRAQYRALKNKKDKADKTGGEVTDGIQESKQPLNVNRDNTTRDVRHLKSAAFNRNASASDRKVFKREEDLDAPRKFSADMLNQALYEKERQQTQSVKPASVGRETVDQSQWSTPDDHVITTAKSMQDHSDKHPVKETATKKDWLSFKERLFGPSEEIDEKTNEEISTKTKYQENAYVTEKPMDDGVKDGDILVSVDQEAKKERHFFGATKIDRFLNITIVLLTIGVIVLTIIAFYV